jgi:anti-anti-sigma factor
MPAEMDVLNAAAVREQLLVLLNRGASVLIVDMTATTFCDCAGAWAVMRASRRAGAAGARVRLVSGGPAVRRTFGLLGIDRMIDVYSSLAAAIAGQAGPRCARHQGTPAQDRPQVSNGGG